MAKDVGVLVKARDNTEKFDFTKFKYEQVFDYLHNDLVLAFKQILPFDVDKSKIVFLNDLDSATGFGVVKEYDDKYYLVLNFELCVLTKAEDEENLFFNLMLTPFNAVLGRQKKYAFDCSSFNSNITKVWRKFLNTKSKLVDDDFKENWLNAFEKYSQEIKSNGIDVE